MPSAEYQREWKKKHPGKQAGYNKTWYKKHKLNMTSELREEIRLKRKEAHIRNKDKENARCREYDRTHSQKRKEYNQEYYLNNHADILIKKRKYHKENGDTIREKKRAYHKTTTGKLVSKKSSANRRALKFKAEGSFTAEDIKGLYAIQGRCCYYCNVGIEGGYHVDHMLPLSRGGSNDVSNICLSCASCNWSKHAKTAEEYQQVIQERGNVCYQG